jgi:hypothetical protein
MCSYSPTGSGISLGRQGSAFAAVVPKIIRSGNTIICVNVGTEANIFSAAGKLVLCQKVPANGVIDVSLLSKGVYLAKAGTALLKFVR